MQTWNGGQPHSLQELFVFYHDYVKELYSYVQTRNELPVETLFEINATLDHVSRHWSHHEAESTVVADAYSHLKRSCLDIFKIRFRETVDQYEQLKETDTSAIDNGDYNRRLHLLFAQTRAEAINARKREGEYDALKIVPAFELWEAVFVKCEQLEKEYFLNPHVTWAKRTGFRAFIRQQWIGFLVGVASSIVAALIYGIAVMISSNIGK